MLVSVNKDNMVFKQHSMTQCEKKSTIMLINKLQEENIVIAEMTRDEIKVKAPKDIMYTMLHKLSNHYDVELM